jgi:tetratricopeptide (TPR) repeat protein
MMTPFVCSNHDAIRLLESFKDIDPLETGKRLVSLYRQLNEQPHVVEELTLLADAFLGKGMHKEALHCYREILTLVPDDESVKMKLIELERKVALESVPAGAEKTVEEALIEADIFIRYGLFDKAKDLLEFFKYQELENRELHTKLKAVYKGVGDQEQAIAECLVLKELFEKAGDQENAQQHVQEAIEINPDDPRLSGLVLTAATQEPDSGDQEQAPSLEDYTDEIAEADFYARQGLIEEARQILEKIQNIFPSNEEIGQKLISLGQISEPEVEHAESSQHETEETAFSEVEALEPEEIAEPELDNDVMDIFNEFKKGLENELEEEDYETHYNLGIAYKEMGLIDDAIREFQTARNDEKKFISSSNMLGMCYMEKGIYSLAIETFRGAVEKMDSHDDSYWPMKYDLAEAYEKNGGVNQALSLFTEVYGWNSRFREVADKIEQLKAKTEDTTDQKTPKDRKDRVSYI